MLPTKQETDYIKEIEKEANVKTHFEKQQDLYSSDINMAIYMDLTDIQKLKVFDIITLNQKQDFLISFYSFRMRLDDNMNQRLYKLFIRQLDPILRKQTNRKYYVVFFDSPSENKNSFDLFKEIFKRLPAIYFVKLHKIFHVNPGFLTKSLELINFTSWSRLFHKYFQYVEEYFFSYLSAQSIQEISELKIFNILVKCPKQITKGITIQSQTPQMARSAMMGTKKPKPFDCLKRQLKQYSIDKGKGVPLILSILIQTMKQCDQLCLAEGIFRVAGSIEDQEDLLKQIFDYKTFRTIDCETHCKRAIAGLMKKIFTESASPLIPYPIYNYLLNQKIDETNIAESWKLILIQLPALNRRILCYVTEFLRDFILKNKEQNKMNSHNLAVVFNPCFFRAKECCIADLMNSGKFAGLFKWWLENYDQVLKSIETPFQHSQAQNQQSLDQSERTRLNASKIKYHGGIFTSNKNTINQ